MVLVALDVFLVWVVSELLVGWGVVLAGVVAQGFADVVGVDDGGAGGLVGLGEEVVLYVLVVVSHLLDLLLGLLLSPLHFQ